MANKILVFAGTAMKNLFSKPATVAFPAEPLTFKEGVRGQVVIDIDDCIFCGMCGRGCPPRAIEVDRKTGSWSINHFDCIQCGYCVDACPKKCLTMLPEFMEPGSEKIVHAIVNPDGPPKPAPKKPAAPKPAAKPAAAANVTPAETAKPAAATAAETVKPVAAAENAKPAAAAETVKPEAAVENVKPAETAAPVEAPKPQKQEEPVEGVNINLDECVYCGLCSRKCPASAITVDRKEKSWEIFRSACVMCGVCVDACPKHCLHIEY